jgi:predicted RNase H-like HicB family nuclease
MAHTKKDRANVPASRIEEYLDNPDPRSEWKTPFVYAGGLRNLFFLHACDEGVFVKAEATEEIEHGGASSDWTSLAQMLIVKLSLDNRVELAEKELKNLSSRLTRIEGLCEKALQGAVCIPISTFAPEPFEIIRDFSVVVQPEEESFVATLFDANISSSGETREEAVANVKDLILMIFRGLEDDVELGPAMIRQKHALMSLIRRK